MKRPLNSCRWGCCSENYFWGEIKVHPHVSSETKIFVRNEPPERRRENREASSGRSGINHLKTWLCSPGVPLRRSPSLSTFHRELSKMWHHVSSLSPRRVRETSSTISERNRYFLFYSECPSKVLVAVAGYVSPFIFGSLHPWFPGSVNKPVVFASNKLTLVMSGKLKL